MSARGLVAAGPRPKELWLTVGLSVLLHGVLVVTVVLAPRFRAGSYVTVPVSYTVDLVSAEPGGRAASPARASTPPPAAPRPAAPPQPPTPQVRTAPPPPPVARPSEELTLPAKRAVQKAPAEVEPSLRLPTSPLRQPVRPAPVDVRPRPAAPPAAPAQPAAPAAPEHSAPPAAPATASTTGAGAGKTSGIELAGGEGGEGAGGSALGYYLGLVDYKISTNWTPVATGGGKDSVVVIRFRVLRSGNVRDVELETSSGEAGVDAAALRAVRQSLPLPPFPNLLTDPFLNLRYRFVMERG